MTAPLTSYCLLLTAYFLLLTAYCLLLHCSLFWCHFETFQAPWSISLNPMRFSSIQRLDMKTKVFVLLLLALAVPATICSGQSSTVKPGKWTGSVTPPNGEETPVTADVTVNGDSLGIVLHAGEHGDFSTTGGFHKEGTITFSFEPGPVVHCTLTKNTEGSYVGECVEDSGDVAQITLVPPKE